MYQRLLYWSISKKQGWNVLETANNYSKPIDVIEKNAKMAPSSI